MTWTVFSLLILCGARAALAAAERRSAPRGQRLRVCGEALETLIIALCLIFLVVRPFVTQPFHISSASMSPSLEAGDRILVNNLVYRLREPLRGEVIAFEPPAAAVSAGSDPEHSLVKRVIALPGDVVEVRRGATYLNGYAQPNLHEAESADDDLAPTVVPRGMLFVAGDERARSRDSRHWGLLPRERVIGRADFVFWPPGRIGRIH